MVSRWTGLAIAAAIGMVQPLQAAPSATDGVLRSFIGDWTVTGTTLGKPTVTKAEVRPQFGDTFLELHVKDPASKNAYEARVFFGKAEDGHLVVHWLDATGGETSRTLGTGQVQGDLVTLSFPYPDGTFRDRLTYDRLRDRWRLFIEMGPLDHPKMFSDWYFDRVKVR